MKSPQIHHQKQAFEKLAFFLDSEAITKVFILVDENTKEYCLPIFNKEYQLPYTLIQIISGEINKNLDTCKNIWQKLTDCGADRNSLLINLGGGVISDMGGFTAATYKRGIRFINIPTTLLGMVDAAIGGKTGIDFNGLKNQIGLFSNPEIILIVPKFLKTLPKRELFSGLAEVIKYGLTDDPSIWETVKKIDIENFTFSTDLIKKSIQIKERIVKQDPTEKGLRKTLNFGHTLGHAIETHFFSKPTKEQLLHGEAIAIGMILAVHLSFQTQGFPLELVADITTHIKRIYKSSIPTKLSSKDYKPILDLLKHDKKNNKGATNFILLSSIGKPILDCQVMESEILRAFEYYNF